MNVKDYEARLYKLPCIVCLHMGIQKNCEELHHAGDATDRDDWNQIPVCKPCHNGPNGIHPSRRRFEMRTKTTEMKLLGMTRKLYAEQYGA